MMSMVLKSYDTGLMSLKGRVQVLETDQVLNTSELGSTPDLGVGLLETLFDFFRLSCLCCLICFQITNFLVPVFRV